MEQTPQTFSEYSESEWPTLPTFLIVALLIIVHPLGIILMWVFAKWSIKIKLLITFGPALIITFLISYIFFSLSGQRQDIKEKIQNKTEINYESTTPQQADGEFPAGIEQKE